MVELKLEPVDWQKYSADHYVSVRVGECQKLCRLSQSRTFKFPTSTVGTSRYGKVEILRRVGSSVICVDPKVGGDVLEVSVPLEGCKLQMGVRLSASDGDDLSPAQVQASKQSRYDAAKDYLDSHHLEVRLSEAMQAVLRERPDDPAAFVAKRLAQNGDIVESLQKAPAPAPAAVAAPAPVEPAPVLQQAQVAPVQQQLQASAPPAAAPAAAGGQPEMPDRIRESTRELLSQASADGRLLEELGKASGQQAADELRERMRGSLAQASTDGRLLAELQKAHGQQGEPTTVESLRLEARRALMQAGEDGSLERAMLEAQESSVSSLRIEARDVLMQACADGSLQRALEETKAEHAAMQANGPELTLPQSQHQQAEPRHAAAPQARGQPTVMPTGVSSMYSPGFPATGVRPGVMML